MSNYTVLKEGVREYKNFLTASEASAMVDYLEANKGDDDLVDLNKVSPLPAVIETVFNKALAEVKDLAGEEDLEPRQLRLWKHPMGASSKPSDYHHFHFVILLNDEYTGGEFIMPSQNITMKPEALSMLVFKAGNEFGVNTITEGDRYSMGGAVRLAGVV